MKKLVEFIPLLLYAISFKSVRDVPIYLESFGTHVWNLIGCKVLCELIFCFRLFV